MKKRLTFVAVVLSVAMLLSGAAICASAAVRELNVADQLITDTGILNDIDWAVPQSDSYVINVDGGTLHYDLSSMAWLVPYDSVIIDADNDATFEFDLVSVKSGNIGLQFHTGLDGVYNVVTLAAAGIYMDKEADIYSDYECTTKVGTSSYNAFTGMANLGEKGKRFVVTYKEDGTVGIQTYAINSDGSYATTVSEQVFLKEYYDFDSAKEHHIGLKFPDGGSMTFDNLKLTNGGKTVFANDCSTGEWLDPTGVSESGKVYASGNAFKTVKESVLDIIDPENSERVVTEEKITVDENVSTIFTFSGALKVKELGKRFGFAFGLNAQDTAVSESSYVYIYNKEETTFIASNKTGEEVSFGKDLTDSDEYVEFKIVGTKDGEVTVEIGEVTAKFTDMNMAGYVAAVTDGEGGNVKVTLDGSMKLIGYKYRQSTGGTVANNFNTGYINGENWALASTQAKNFENADDAKGLVVEDGALFFNGTALGSWFGTVDSYADFVLEFDYTSLATSTRPAVKEAWTTGYSVMWVIIGGTEGYGWLNGVMCYFDEKSGEAHFQNFKEDKINNVTAQNSFDFNASSTADKTSAIKIVAAGNNIKIYIQDITSAPFDKDNYTLLTETNVGDTYGTIAIATDDCGYFKIDNLRITPVDDPDDAKVQENLAAYVDKQPIDDEYRPVELDAPVLMLTDNVVTWEAVEDAIGYQVIVNGVKQEVQSETSYTVTATEDGDYVISVIAIGNGDWISDSEQSATVTYVKGSNTNNGGADSDGGCGCDGSVSVNVFFGFGVLLLAGVAVLMSFKRKSANK